MISIFKPYDEFSLSTHGELIKQNYRLLSELFEGLPVEFFYYLTPSDPERFFIVRIKNVEPESFAGAMEILGENLSFPKLSPAQARAFIERTPPLDAYQ